MTQQPYQQGPPPGWDPNQYQPPQQQEPPPGWPGRPVPGPFQQTGQVAQPAAPGGPAGGDPFGAPGAATGGGDSPRIAQLEGRLVLWRPTSFEANSAGGAGFDPSDLVVTEAVIIDGPPIPGSLDGNSGVMTPFAAGPKVAPFYVGSMWIRGKVVPSQLKEYVPGRGFCLGRVAKGKPASTGKPPWIIADPTEEDRVIGRQIHAAWEQIKAAVQAAPAPEQFGAPGAQQGPPPGWGQPAPQPAPPAWGQQPPWPAQ